MCSQVCHSLHRSLALLLWRGSVPGAIPHHASLEIFFNCRALLPHTHISVKSGKAKTSSGDFMFH